jgi:hypothetical protein
MNMAKTETLLTNQSDKESYKLTIMNRTTVSKALTYFRGSGVLDCTTSGKEDPQSATIASPILPSQLLLRLAYSKNKLLGSAPGLQEGTRGEAPSLGHRLAPENKQNYGPQVGPRRANAKRRKPGNKKKITRSVPSGLRACPNSAPGDRVARLALLLYPDYLRPPIFSRLRLKAVFAPKTEITFGIITHLLILRFQGMERS